MKITMYTSKTCSRCAMAKNYLDEKGVNYEVILTDNFTGDEMTKLIDKANGAMMLPIIFVDDKVFAGNDWKKIKELV